MASAMESLMQVYDPINLYDQKLRDLASAFGSVWVRVSGTWATKTYYDFEGAGVVPEGYQNRLTKEQWIGVLDFVKAINAKLLISVANCEGLHKAEEPWNPSQVEKIFALSKEHGVAIDAVEFTNEPNMLDMTGFPENYTAADYARDQDLFHKWVRDNYPGTLIVGPCATESALGSAEDNKGGGLASSDYGFLQHGTFDPRPNYFAVLLWNRIMGTTVYDTKEEIREGAHVFAHSRRDGKDGVAYLIINNSETEATTLEPAAIAFIVM